MTFLALDSQKSLFTIQRNQLAFEQTLVMNQANWVSKQMGAMAQDSSDDSDYELESDPVYITLKQQEDYLTTRQKALDQQLQLIDAEINSMKTMVQNNIKSSCTLNLIGG